MSFDLSSSDKNTRFHGVLLCSRLSWQVGSSLTGIARQILKCSQKCCKKIPRCYLQAVAFRWISAHLSGIGECRFCDVSRTLLIHVNVNVLPVSSLTSKTWCCAIATISKKVRFVLSAWRKITDEGRSTGNYW